MKSLYNGDGDVIDDAEETCYGLDPSTPDSEGGE
jgi:hypothetical protein